MTSIKHIFVEYSDGKGFEIYEDGDSEQQNRMQRAVDALLDNDDKEKEYTFSFYGGAAAAYERVAKHIFQKSAELFLDGNDEEARSFRGLAEEIKEWGDIERTEQKQYE